MTAVRLSPPQAQPTTQPVVVQPLSPSAPLPASWTLSSPDAPTPRIHVNDAQPETGSALGAFFGTVARSRTARILMLSTSGIATFAGAGVAQVRAATNDNVQAVDKSVVFIGMNETSAHEVQTLRNAGVQVTYIAPAKTADSIKLGSKTYDLKTPEGRDDFVKAVGLTGDRAAAVSTALEEVGDNARDEAAQLVKVLREAETGKRKIERMVLSGHSVGSMVWGDGNGTLRLENLGKLVGLFPRAAGQVEDLMIAACYSGGESTMDSYRAMFPNMKTLWAYDGSAPGSYSGATGHMTRWERGSRGETTNLNRNVVDGLRKGENVAVWTASRGYDNGKPVGEIQYDQDRYNQTAGIVADFKSGKEVVENSQHGPLRDHYNSIQRLLSRRDLAPDQRVALSAERDLVIRVLFFDNVKSLFQTTNASAIRAGYRDLGMQVPDFSKMSRKEVLSTIEAFDAAKAGQTNPSRNVTFLEKLLHDGLRDLSPSLVPNSWL